MTGFVFIMSSGKLLGSLISSFATLLIFNFDVKVIISCWANLKLWVEEMGAQLKDEVG